MQFRKVTLVLLLLAVFLFQLLAQKLFVLLMLVDSTLKGSQYETSLYPLMFKADFLPLAP